MMRTRSQALLAATSLACLAVAAANCGQRPRRPPPGVPYAGAVEVFRWTTLLETSASQLLAIAGWTGAPMYYQPTNAEPALGTCQFEYPASPVALEFLGGGGIPGLVLPNPLDFRDAGTVTVTTPTSQYFLNDVPPYTALKSDPFVPGAYDEFRGTGGSVSAFTADIAGPADLVVKSTTPPYLAVGTTGAVGVTLAPSQPLEIAWEPTGNSAPVWIVLDAVDPYHARVCAFPDTGTAVIAASDLRGAGEFRVERTRYGSFVTSSGELTLTAATVARDGAIFYSN